MWLARSWLAETHPQNTTARNVSGNPFAPGWAHKSSGSTSPKASLRICVHQCQVFHKSVARCKIGTEKKAGWVFLKVECIHLKDCPFFCCVFVFVFSFWTWKCPFSYEITVIRNGRLYTVFILCFLLGQPVSAFKLTLEIPLTWEIEYSGNCCVPGMQEGWDLWDPLLHERGCRA